MIDRSRSRRPRRQVILAILALLATASCGRVSETWSVQVLVEEGIPHLYNPEVPFWGSEARPFELVEVLGADSSDSRPLFTRPLTVAVGVDGIRYVLDQRACCIWRFNAVGEPLEPIGRRGDGPGEFRNPADMTILHDGTLVVNDQVLLRLSFFDAGGTFLQSVPFGDSIGQLEPAGADRFFVYRRDRTTSARASGLEADPEIPQLRIIDEEAGTITAFSRRRGPTGQDADIHINKLFLAALPGDSLLVSYQGLDRFEVFSPQGTLARVIHRTKPFATTEPVYQEQDRGPGLQPFVGWSYDVLSSGLAVSPDGQHWVVLIPQSPARERTRLVGEPEIPDFWSFELFNSAGHWLARQTLEIVCPRALLDWGTDGLYVINPEGDAAVYRFAFRSVVRR